MKKSSLAAIVVAVAAMLSLALAACSAGGAAPSAGAAGDSPVEQLSASVVKFNLDGSGDALEARVTVNSGESYVVASSLESGEAEIVLKNPEGDISDYAYDGFSVGTTEIPAGTYDVTVKPGDANGTIYVLSFPAEELDVMNAETEDLFNQVAEFAASGV